MREQLDDGSALLIHVKHMSCDDRRIYISAYRNPLTFHRIELFGVISTRHGLRCRLTGVGAIGVPCRVVNHNTAHLTESISQWLGMTRT